MKKTIIIIIIVALLFGITALAVQVENLKNENEKLTAELFETNSNLDAAKVELQRRLENNDQAAWVIEAFIHYCKDLYRQNVIGGEYGPFLDGEYVETLLKLMK